MKRTASILTILIAAFIVGCQGNNITDPITATASEAQRLSKAHPANTLPLNAVLREPGNVVNSFVENIGTVAFTATVVPLDPIPPNPQYAVRLNLTAGAEVRPYQVSVPPLLPVWYVSGTSDDWVPIPESGATSLTKRYQIEGRSDRMILNVRFRITLTSVEVSSMWLELPRTGRAADID